MSQTIAEDILSQLRGGSLNQIAQQVGASEQETENAISSALPLLLGALGHNAQQPDGAQALFGALLRDHGGAQQTAGGFDAGSLLGTLLGGAGGSAAAGSLLGGLGGLLGGAVNSSQANGEGILGHVFGNKLAHAENNLGQASGLNSDGIHKLLVILAPIVLGYLGKQVAQGSASDPDALGSLLGQERQQIQQQGGLAGNLLSSVLDQDGDGKLGVGDLLKFGAGFLNKR